MDPCKGLSLASQTILLNESQKQWETLSQRNKVDRAWRIIASIVLILCACTQCTCILMCTHTDTHMHTQAHTKQLRNNCLCSIQGSHLKSYPSKKEGLMCKGQLYETLLFFPAFRHLERTHRHRHTDGEVGAYGSPKWLSCHPAQVYLFLHVVTVFLWKEPDVDSLLVGNLVPVVTP